jgi:hypothetical protein
MLRMIGNLWCKLLHNRTTWPMHGHYACRLCGRRYPVKWEFLELSSNLEELPIEPRRRWQERSAEQ